ncbi:glycoside hydrolase family 128 protein [Zopfia rhizophila CBS 207.26]|uniref:Glycoside hydrolase family 128 protein n=1 Tax=Zopfia rhizophila CBS 207.26 TaxID=1314779 RepID=A0A6A6EW50_9PEZI|nr:glycoside hydrolase family 128 protein [Zopfia rhizophila CBS 207.26]
MIIFRHCYKLVETSYLSSNRYALFFFLRLSVNSTLTLALRTVSTIPLTLPAMSSKRGLCHVATPDSSLTWYYSYQYKPSLGYENGKMKFIKSGSMIEYVLGFNDPDGPHKYGGSDVPADLAARRWKAEIEPLKKLGVKLGAPALEYWFRESDGGDGKPYRTGYGHASELTVWVPEWGFPQQSVKDTHAFYNISTEWFDRMENITHYSYFGAFRSDGEMTDIGSWYLGGKATNNVTRGTAVRATLFAGWI